LRLAAKLTGWRLDVVGETKYNEALKDGFRSLLDLSGVGEKIATELYDSDFRSARDIASATTEELMVVKGISKEKADGLIAEANEYLAAAAARERTAAESKTDNADENEAAKEEETGEVSDTAPPEVDAVKLSETKVSTDES
jgi:N utilization substance protein A